MWDATFRKNTLMRLDAIFIGVLFAFFKFYYKEIFVRTKFYQASLGIIGLIFTIFYFYKSPSFDTSLFAKTLYFIITNISVALFLSLADETRTRTKTSKRSFFYKLVTHISLISYSLYLYHLLVMTTINLYFKTNGILSYVLFWIITFVISTLVFKFFEKPFTELRDRNRLHTT